MSELKDRIKNDTDMSNTDVNAVNNVYRGDLETAVLNARIRIEAIDGDTHTEEEYNAWLASEAEYLDFDDSDDDWGDDDW